MKKLTLAGIGLVGSTLCMAESTNINIQTIQSHSNVFMIYGKIEHAQKTISLDNHYYVIKFEYDSMYVYIPATIPPGEPHHTALISVYEIIDGKEVLVCPAFPGQYIGDPGCYEDDPKTLVQTSLKIKENK